VSLQRAPDTGVLPILKGLVRLTGILAVILMFSPTQAMVLWLRCGDPFFIPRLFHILVLRILGFKRRVHGTPAREGPVLYVANHTSYLDVTVLGTILRAAFVSKAEVKGWPVVGILARLHRSAFVERRSVRAAEQRDTLSQRLFQGDSLILFAEGTSSDGQRVLPFKSSLFAVAGLNRADGRPVQVQPVTVVCTEIGGLPAARAWRPYYAWFGDMTFVPHLWNVLKMGRFTVDVTFFPPVILKDFADRKALADYCHDVIARGVERNLTGRMMSNKSPNK
jgi:lyso-ornithine lipid O-acyltransferase